ncbi:MAG: methyl-accepting chemotaxis protein, partial [Burkholderiaceae bacterium]|nr:methyl-accepting chemotaxis protein [Burkholderiaceae bacterium]
MHVFKLSLPPPGALGKRLLSIFLAVLLLALLGSAIGIWSIRQIHHAMEHGVQQSVNTERLVADAYRYQAINAERYKAMALSSEPEVGEILGRDIEAAEKNYEALLAALAQRLQTSPDQPLLTHIRT